MGWVFTYIAFKMIISFWILFFAPNSINKHCLWYKHTSITIIVSWLLVHFLIFLFVVFIVVVFCPISYSFHSLLRLHLWGSSSSYSKPFENVSLCVIMFLLLQLPFSSFTITYVPLVTWWHFMLLDAWTSPSWSMI